MDSEKDKLQKEVDRLKQDLDMASGCFQMILESFEGYECMHGKKYHVFASPMFIPELTHCIISKARLDGISAAIAFQFKHAEIVFSPHINLDTKKRIWEEYIKENKNEMERPTQDSS